MGVVRAAQVAGLLYVGRNVVQVIASYPLGALADRFGSRPVLLAGYALGSLTAALAAAAFSWRVDDVVLLASLFAVAGLYVAVQEALESTVTAEMVGTEMLNLGIGALVKIDGTAKFISSAAVGLVWSAVSPALGFGIAALFMAAGTWALACFATR